MSLRITVTKRLAFPDDDFAENEPRMRRMSFRIELFFARRFPKTVLEVQFRRRSAYQNNVYTSLTSSQLIPCLTPLLDIELPFLTSFPLLCSTRHSG